MAGGWCQELGLSLHESIIDVTESDRLTRGLSSALVSSGGGGGGGANEGGRGRMRQNIVGYSLKQRVGHSGTRSSV